MPQSAGTTSEDTPRPNPTLRLAAALAIVFAVALILLGITASQVQSADNQDAVRIEIIKSLLQLAVIIIVGGVVAALIREVERQQTQARAYAEARKDYLDRLGNAYRKVKAIRRTLRARGLTSKRRDAPEQLDADQLAFYQTAMERIDDVQLELEALKHEAQSLPAFTELGQTAEVIAAHLESMEQYLGKLFSEYEEFMRPVGQGEPVLFSSLRRLDEFTGKVGQRVGFSAESERFKSDFSRPFHQTMQLIRSHLA